jgi:hypothetical protein
MCLACSAVKRTMCAAHAASIPGKSNQRVRQAVQLDVADASATDTAHPCTPQYFNANVKQRASMNARLIFVKLIETLQAHETPSTCMMWTPQASQPRGKLPAHDDSARVKKPVETLLRVLRMHGLAVRRATHSHSMAC